MANVQLVTTSTGSVSANLTRYVASSDSGGTATSLETDTQQTLRTAGSIAKLLVSVSFNSTYGYTTSTTVTSRLNAAAGNLSASIPAGATGEFEDTSNSDTVSAGDKINYRVVTGNGILTIQVISTTYSATANTVKKLFSGNASFAFSSVSTTAFMNLTGNGNVTLATESSAQYKVRGTATLKNFFVNVTSNNRTDTTTFGSRKNTAAGALTVSVGSLTSGIFEDTTHSDSLVATDLSNYFISTSVDNNFITFKGIGAEFLTTTDQFVMFNGSGGNGYSLNQTVYTPVGGNIQAASEATTQTKSRLNFTAANMGVRVATNPITAASTVTFRKNAVDGTLSSSITASSTGYFEDTTHSDSVVSGNEINYKIITGATGSNFLSMVFIASLATTAPLLVSVSDSSTITEYVTVTGPFDPATTKLISVNDNTTVTDTAAENVPDYSLSVNVSDTTAVTENRSFLSEGNINKSESSTITENVVITESATLITVSDSTAVTENAVVALAQQINKSDSSTLTENVVRMAENYINKSDSTTLTENTQVVVVGNINVNDTTAITENIVLMADENINKSDTSAITELVVVALAQQINKSDSSTLTENIVLMAENYINKSESSTVTENVVVTQAFQVNISSDTLAVTDTVALNIPGYSLSVNVNDTSAVTENVVVTQAFQVNKSDTTTVTESIALNIPDYSLSVNVNDTSTVSDTVTTSSSATLINVNDTTTITESVTFDQPGGRFWVGGSGNFSSATNWSASSGGSGGASVPSSNNTITFDSNSGTGTVTFDTNPTIQSITSSSANITLSLSSSSMTITNTGTAWNLTAGSVTAGTSTITMTGAGVTFAGGSKTYGNVTLSGSGTAVISGSNTFATLTRTGTASLNDVLQLTGATTQTCTNFTCTGNSLVNRLFLRTSSAFTGVATISVSSTVSVTNTDLMGIKGAGAASWNISATSTGDCGGNQTMTLTSAQTNYWSSGTGNFSTTSNWYLGSGGTGGAGRIPLPQDTAVFDTNSFTAGSQTHTFDMPRISVISCTSVTNNPTLSVGLSTISYFGNVTLCPSMTLAFGANTLQFFNFYTSATLTSSTATYTATSAGILSTNNGISSATLTFADSLSFPGSGIAAFGGRIIATNGITVTTAVVTCGIFGNLTLGGAGTTWNLTGTSGTVWNYQGNAVTNGSGSAIVIQNAGSSTRTFAGNGQTYGTLTYSVAGSTGELDITGSNTFETINFSDSSNARTLAFTAATTTTITNSFNVQGSTSGNMTVDSITASTHTLSKTSGTVACDYLTVGHSTAQGGAIWVAGLHSTDNGNNLGWVFGGSDVVDTSTLTESTTVRIQGDLTVSNSSTITENTIVSIQGGLNVSDSSTITDTINLVIESLVQVSDSSAITENINLIISTDSELITTSDSSTVTENTQVVVESVINLSDTSTVTDNTVVTTGSSQVSVSDSSTLTENIQVSIQAVINASDSTTLTENVSLITDGVLSASDSTTITEFIALVFDDGLVLSDTSTVTDSVVVTQVYQVSVSDTATLSENLSLTRDYQVIVSDNTSITENILFNQAGIRYWVGGTGNWDNSSTSHWSATSGGSAGASAPTSFNDAIFNSSSGSGTVTLTADVTFNTLSSSGSGITISAGSHTLNVIGDNTAWTWTAGTFTGGTSTINLTGSNVTFAGGSKTYRDVNLTGGGVVTITGNNTFHNFTCTGSADVNDGLILPASGTTTCTNFTVTGNSTINRLFLKTTDPYDGQTTISVSTAVSVTNTDLLGIVGTGAANWDISATSTGDCGGNSMTLTTPQTNYWYLDGGNYSATSNWYLGSGGSGGAGRIPLPQDTVFFDVNSFSTSSQTVTFDMPRIGQISCDSLTNDPTLSLDVAGSIVSYFGSLILCPGMTFDFGTNSLRYMNHANSAAYTSNGAVYAATTGTWLVDNSRDGLSLTLADDLIFPGSGGVVNLSGNLVASAGITVETPKLSVGQYGVLDLGGTATNWNLTATTGTLVDVTGQVGNSFGSTILVKNASTSTRTFIGGDQNYGSLTYIVSGSSGELDITGSNTFDTINFTDSSSARSLAFEAGTNTTINDTFNVNGSSGQLMTITSTTAANHSLTKSTSTVTCDYLSIDHSDAGGGATWIAGLHSINGGNNSGWIFGGTTISDTITVTDARTVRIQSLITKSETTTISESYLVVAVSPNQIVIALNDTAPLTDSPTVVTENNVNVVDTSTITETIQLLATAIINVNDNSSLSENISLAIQSAADQTVTVSDNSSLSDNTVVVVEVTITVSDNSTITESVVVQGQAVITVNDSTNLSELIIISVDEQVAVTDNTSLSENLVVTPQAAAPLSVTTSDSTNITELVIMQASDDEGMFETITITENVVVVIVAAASLTVNASDSPSITELVIISVDEQVDVSDSTNLSENLVVTPQSAAPLSITTSDSTNLSELVIMLAGDDEGMFETVVVSENVVVVIVAVPTLTITTSDNSSITESEVVVVQTLSNLLITVNETINTAEARAISINNLLLAIAVSDSVTTAESLSLTITAINLAIKFLEFFE